MGHSPDETEKKSSITAFAGQDGEYKRQTSQFRDAIEEGGKFPPEKGRYHLYVSYACPWAHRALIVRRLKGLEEFIDISVVHPHMLEGGWHFVPKERESSNDSPASAHDNESFPNSTIDHVHGYPYLNNVYKAAKPGYADRFTVPVVWDKKTGTIVNNESAEVLRFLNTGFNSVISGKEKELDLYPSDLRKEIDELNEWVYDGINNGVYKTGFATKQEVYNSHVKKVFESLDKIEQRLGDGREYLFGDRLTEADIRLYTTIVRFDPVYQFHFKCNLASIRHDYPQINKWLKNLYWNNPAFKETTFFDHIVEHYTYSHAQINPNRIVPAGPRIMIEPL